MGDKNHEIPYYNDYIHPRLKDYLISEGSPCDHDKDLIQFGQGGSLETPKALKFMTNIHLKVQNNLARVLKQRQMDRKFIDDRTRALTKVNRDSHVDYQSQYYCTSIGLADESNRIVFGPLTDNFHKAHGQSVAPYKEEWKGPQVTLFGPPQSPKMAINAMNSYHRRLENEPPIVESLLAKQYIRPRWGADLEDSKTPLRRDLMQAAENLKDCLDGSLSYKDPKNGKEYRLSDDHRSLPIKRFPGLALPCHFMFYRGEPIPLHIYDFALHLYHNWQNEDGLIFYVPKIENEEEAAYIKNMVASAELLLHEEFPDYKPGAIRLMIVLENPRAIFRVNEIMDALDPYFIGVSLGWHDYLGSTARLFKEDSNYRIPVKADPHIVIKHIKSSHELVARVVGERGGITVGGMYGILPLESDIQSPSFQVALKGFFEDTITQLRRGLNGFWLAHPDFVRIGLAIAIAWEEDETSRSKIIKDLADDLLDDPYASQIAELLDKNEPSSIDKDDPLFNRRLIVADLPESDYVKNNSPEEVRYNIFQSLQYLADWLSGNGCVALPTSIDGKAVRVMDDLATAERSRWEVWHEIYHGRFSLGDYIRIAYEEQIFIQQDLTSNEKSVQVKWDEHSKKWYPIAFQIMLQLMTDPEPVEFATELLLPFTIETIREAEDPLREAQNLCPGKYRLSPWLDRYLSYYDACACHRFAKTMADLPIMDSDAVSNFFQTLTIEEVQEAARHHGDIGAERASLDKKAASEQAGVSDDQDIREKLLSLGDQYKRLFGFKFLISAQGLSGSRMLESLQTRLRNSPSQELTHAQQALGAITLNRLQNQPPDSIAAKGESLAKQYGIVGTSLAVSENGSIQSLSWGDTKRGSEPVKPETRFDIASLSKSIASAFAMELMSEHLISIDDNVNRILELLDSPFRLTCRENPEWLEELAIKDLMSHTGLNMHYVKAIPLDQAPKNIYSLLHDPEEFGYESIEVIYQPGSRFSYSGAGFMVLEHIVDLLTKGQTFEHAKRFFSELDIHHMSLDRSDLSHSLAEPIQENGEPFSKGPFWFPGFAAGFKANAESVCRFLSHLEQAYHNLDGSGAISHDTAIKMLHGDDKGSVEFMGLEMGLGIFVGKAGQNRFAIHQGANEGFRAMFLHCFDGPDRGKGFTILCNGDNNGVPYLSRLAQLILTEKSYRGIDTHQFKQCSDLTSIAQEQIVNRGFKDLVFRCFEPLLPENIVDKGQLDPIAEFNILNDATITYVSDQSFARAENLISDRLPSFDPSLFGKQGKVMDSWETRRHNSKGVDEVQMNIQKLSKVRYIQISTEYHDGNHGAQASLYGRASDKQNWQPILEDFPLSGHSLHRIRLDNESPKYCQWRLKMYPDGGISRLGLYEDLPEDLKGQFKLQKDSRGKRFDYEIPKVSKLPSLPTSILSHLPTKKYDEKNFASSYRGARILDVSNEHYGPAEAILSPLPPLHMFDGFESARSRDRENFEYIKVQLAEPIAISHIEIDFTFFKNNNPNEISIVGFDNNKETELIKTSKTKAYAGNKLRLSIDSDQVFSAVGLKIFPDGGLNRLKVFRKELI
ncbi:serine hydrolase [Pseudobacteriovorax antillogorgiicola]|uniref:malate synthase n=1 Tax=Pseudobacteriovorax antillogorgiicola TaxID=1513793 RepID=A0A1Y6CCT7_9BACT|nr:serine hydrolase [Pseudobacteriovorax antillogorgiicola]TCS48250.1 allantoicase [Pseudobacteriovorax antillogorgiicola]SMF57231.1 Allantoicase [Pseudobacteriovorax antillogorgiicola]